MEEFNGVAQYDHDAVPLGVAAGATATTIGAGAAAGATAVVVTTSTAVGAAAEAAALRAGASSELAGIARVSAASGTGAAELQTLQDVSTNHAASPQNTGIAGLLGAVGGANVTAIPGTGSGAVGAKALIGAAWGMIAAPFTSPPKSVSDIATNAAVGAVGSHTQTGASAIGVGQALHSSGCSNEKQCK